jgi:glycosyltransferase involved in cell wall biosynthesis
MEGRAGAGYRVLMTADPVGGVWTYAMVLTKALAPHGVEVHLATLGGAVQDSQQQEANQHQNLTLYPSAFKLEWMDNPWDDLEAAEAWLLDLCKKVQPDLVQLNNLAFGNLDWQKPVVQVVHSCVRSWWRAVKKEEAPASWNRYTELVRESLRAADLVVAPSQAMLAEARELYGPFRAEQVIHNGLEARDFRNGPKEPIIFSLGRVWDEAKNLAALAQVAPRLSWPVYIAGEAVHPVTGQPVELPNVHILGRLPPAEVKDWLARASVFALPARYEPFGLAVLEAALSGCALVLGDLKSLREVWGSAAHYVDPEAPDQLQAALEKLTQDESVRLGSSSQTSRQASFYTSGRMAQQYALTYKEAVSYRMQAASVR